MKNVILYFNPVFMRYHSKNFYTRTYKIGDIENTTATRLEFTLYELRSYDTIIGYFIPMLKKVFTWGYKTYSRTTSRQITDFCNEQSATRCDIKKRSLEEFIKDYLKG